MRNKHLLISFIERTSTIKISILVLALIISFFSEKSSAQTVVTIGTASSTTSLSGLANSTTTGSRNERHMCIYSATELSTAGMSSGNTLLSIAWEKTGAANYAGNDLTIRIWLKHNASTTFPANPTFATEIASATMVFQTTTGTIPESSGWLTFDFNTAVFAWNGTDNLQVITELIRPASWTTTGFSWRTITSLTNGAANASGTAAAPPATLTRTGTRPQVRFEVAATGNDAALESMPNPVSAPAGVQNIDVVLRNTGTTTLTTADIGWTINGGPSTNYAWSGSLLPGQRTTVTIASPSFSLGSNTVQATVSNPNGSPDQNPANNVITKIILICNPLSGAYTINKTMPTSVTNFNSFNDFSYYLTNCGINANVTATVAPGTGPYNEQVVFQNIAGLGASATITIEGNGETIVSDTAIVQTGSNPNRHIIRLVDLQYFTINNLHVDMFPGSTGFIGIQALNSGNHITISNCVVNIGSATSTLLGAFVFNGDPASIINTGGVFDNILVTGNTTMGGGYGISVFGLASPNLATNVIINNNNFYDFNSNGVYLRETDGAEVSDNHFDKSAGSVSSTNAIQLAQNLNVNGRVFNNYIKMSQTTGSLVGIYLFNGTGHKVYNNVIYDIHSTTGTIEGIKIRTAGTAPEIYFNTITFDNTNASTGDLWGLRTETTGTSANIRNNIINITQPTSGFKSCIMLNSSSNVNTTFSISNNNVFWIPGGYLAGYMNVVTPTVLATTLADWQTLSGKDANSFQTDPLFQSGIAIPQSSVIADQGIMIPGITTDIVGTIRNNPPDPGAYEFVPPAFDAAITNFILPAIPHCANTLDVQFELTNAGGAPLNTVTIDWTVNGVPQPTVNWAGPTLAPGASTVVTLGTIPVSGPNLYNFTATSSNPNGVPDANPVNDSYTFNGFRRGLEGSFTIDGSSPASPTNYQSFQSIANALNQWGVCTAVTINVMNGPYTEQVVFNTIPGTNGTNTVTLNGNSQVLQYNPTNVNDDHILQLNGVTYMTVENLTVNSLHATQGRGIHITNAASKLTIRNNTVNVSMMNSTSSSFGIIISGENWLLDGSLSDSVEIYNNTVSGGYSAIQLSGEHWTQPLTQIKVFDNTVLDWYGFGVYLSYTNNAIVRNNIIRRPLRTNSGSDAVTPAGITVPAGSLGFLLEKNRIFDLHVSMPQHSSISRGIYMSGTTTAPTSGTIQNNLIYGMNNDGAQYGIQSESATGPVNIYHNTVVLNNATAATTSNTTAMYLARFAIQLDHDIKNNVFVVTRGGSGVKRIFDITTGTLNSASNYNVTYLNASGTQRFGEIGSTFYNTLADWQTTGRDLNSVHIDPLFANPPTGNFTPTEYFADGAVMGTSSVGVLDDILGNPRSANPDPGAFEFIPPPCTGANGGTASTSSGPFCSSGSGTITATGYSSGTGISYQWQYSNDNFVSNINDLVGQTNPASASTGTITSTTYYRLRVTCSVGPVTAYSNIVTIVVNQPIVITTHPVSQNVCVGSNVTFTVIATGTISGYQWRKDNNPISGASSSSYTITGVVAGDAGNYDVLISGPCGNVTSNVAALAVAGGATITSQPSNIAACPGETRVFTIVVSAPTGLSYQWQVSTNGGGTWSNIAGEIFPNLTLANLTTTMNGYQYRVIVSGCGSPFTSNAATLTVYSAVAITTAPANVSACAGNNATFSVVATGSPTPLAYQWQISTDGGVNYNNIAGANGSSLTLIGVTTAMNTYRYRVIVTGYCGSVTSTAGILTVNVATTPVTVSGLPSRICLSDTLIALTGTPVGGVWSGVGIIGNNFLPYRTAVGTYTLTYTFTNSFGCASSATLIAKVEDCPERRILLRDDAVIVYPNPNNGQFNIRINSTLYSYLGMKVYDAGGALVHLQNFTGLQYGRVIPIDLRRLSAGVYNVYIYYDGGVRTSEKTFKVIIGSH